MSICIKKIPYLIPLVFCLFQSSTISAEVQRYEIQAIETLGGTESYAYDINNLGNIVGGSTNNNGVKHAFFAENVDNEWLLTDLDTIRENFESEAKAINDHNQIVGYFKSPTLDGQLIDHAFYSEFDGSIWKNTDLYAIGNLATTGTTASIAEDINNSGQIIGHSAGYKTETLHRISPFVAYKGSISWEAYDLYSILGGDSTRGFGINDKAQLSISRYQRRRYSTGHAVEYTNGAWSNTDIGSLSDVPGAHVTRNNNLNQMTGYGLVFDERTTSNKAHAFLAQKNSAGEWGLKDLGELNGLQTFGHDINDNGVVVGSARENVILLTPEQQATETAFVYLNENIYALETLITEGNQGWTKLYSANGINNLGQIVGVGLYNGNKTAFVATPISEQQREIIIDGDRSDWSGIMAFGDNFSEQLSPIDIQSIQITGNNEKVYIALGERILINQDLNWARQLIIDTDFKSTTGFRYYDFDMGGDFLLAGNSLYRYTGDGTTWEWSFVRNVEAAVSGTFAELAIDRSIIGNSNRFKITYYGANSFVNGSTDDFFSLTAYTTGSDPIVTIDGNNNDWPESEAVADNISGTSPIDFLKVWFMQDFYNAYFAYENRTPIDLPNFWAHIILIDSGIPTGYQFHSIKGDYLIQGKELYRYIGSGYDWKWQFIKNIEWAVNDKFVELAVDKADLGNANDYKIIFYGANSYTNGGDGSDFSDDSVLHYILRDR